MKFNIKSKKGFTRIELLVVIGILAVLAAIAIPSVAGLIDRANVSADNTNANEMTNAMERFVSEYELYKQDIASGAIKDGDGDGVPDNMDAAQGRVYNVTKAVTRADIEKLESKAGFNGIRIDIDNKYAQNHATAKAVMQNYMKTNSSTFEPKQSDMTYWYNTVTGYTVVAEKNIDTAELENLLPQELKYGNGKSVYLTDWIDLSSNVILPDIHIDRVYAFVNYQEGRDAIVYRIFFPNPKYFSNMQYDKVFILSDRGGDTEGVLDINTASVKVNFYEHVRNDSNIMDKLFNSNEEYVFVSQGLFAPNELKDTKFRFRLAYEYEENGITKYIYTPSIQYSYNELTEYSSDNLPY